MSKFKFKPLGMLMIGFALGLLAGPLRNLVLQMAQTTPINHTQIDFEERRQVIPAEVHTIQAAFHKPQKLSDVLILAKEARDRQKAQGDQVVDYGKRIATCSPDLLAWTSRDFPNDTGGFKLTLKLGSKSTAAQPPAQSAARIGWKSESGISTS